jgi:hypothetical protein
VAEQEEAKSNAEMTESKNEVNTLSLRPLSIIPDSMKRVIYLFNDSRKKGYLFARKSL